MADSKRRDFLKLSALAATALPALPLLQSLQTNEIQTPKEDSKTEGLRMALSRISPYYLNQTANLLNSGLQQLTGQSWVAAPQVQDLLLESLKSNEVQAAVISPSYYKNFPKKAALFGSIPHGLSDKEFDTWVKSPNANELREEIYGKYDVVAIPLGAFAEASGFYSRFADTEEGTRAVHEGFETVETKPVLLSPFQTLAHFESGRIDRSHTLAHRQHVNLGLPKQEVYYHETRGLRSAASFELLLRKDIWMAFSEKSRYELNKVVTHAGSELRQRLAQLDSHYASSIRGLSQVKFKAASATIENNLREERSKLFEKLIASNPELQPWQSRMA